MSALSPAPAPASGVRSANLLTPLKFARTDCCLSYKQNVPISPLESALTNTSHLLDSAHIKIPCFDTLAALSPVTPLESALTKTPGVGGPPAFRATLRCRHHMRHVAPLSPVASLDCAYFPSPRGCTLRASDLSAFAASPIGSSFVFTNLQIPFPATPLFSHQYKTPGVGAVLRRFAFPFARHSSLSTRHSYRVRRSAGRSAARGCPVDFRWPRLSRSEPRIRHPQHHASSS